jgi:hypothetical protein
MSKNSHKSIPSHIDDNEPTGTFNVFTRKQGQSLIKDNMAFAHNLLQRKDVVPGILTVATTQSRLTGEFSGEGSLNCVPDQYYMLLLSAVSTILAAMDEHGALKNIGVDITELSFEALDFIICLIEDKLSLEIGDDEELDRLIAKDENIIEFLDKHYESILRLGFVEDEE